MEAIFTKAKEEQEKAELAFQKEQQQGAISSGVNTDDLNSGETAISAGDSKPKRRSRKASDPLINGSSTAKDKKLVPGSTVRVVSGTFAEFEGSLKKLNRRTKKVYCLWRELLDIKLIEEMCMHAFLLGICMAEILVSPYALIHSRILTRCLK